MNRPTIRCTPVHRVPVRRAVYGEMHVSLRDERPVAEPWPVTHTQKQSCQADVSGLNGPESAANTQVLGRRTAM
jgi:hypothetical protein